MPIWILIIAFIVYGLFEFVNSIFFNWRLMLLSEKKFNTAGIFAAVSTFMFISSIILAAWVGTDSGDSTAWWIVPLTAVSMGIGNFFAALLVPKIRSYLENKKNNKQDKTND